MEPNAIKKRPLEDEDRWHGMPKQQKDEFQVFFAILISVFMIALLTRCYYIIKYPVQDRDVYVYERLAQESVNQEDTRINETIPPLAVKLIRESDRWLGLGIIKSGIVMNMVLGIGISLITLVIADLICGNPIITMCVGLISATHPTLVHYSTQMLRENSYLFFATLSIMFMVKYAISKKKANIVLIALTTMASTLCRHEGLELIVLTLFLLLFNNSKKEIPKVLVLYLFVLIASFVFLTILSDYSFTRYKFYKEVFDRISF